MDGRGSMSPCCLSFPLAQALLDMLELLVVYQQDMWFVKRLPSTHGIMPATLPSSAALAHFSRAFLDASCRLLAWSLLRRGRHASCPDFLQKTAGGWDEPCLSAPPQTTDVHGQSVIRIQNHAWICVVFSLLLLPLHESFFERSYRGACLLLLALLSLQQYSKRFDDDDDGHDDDDDDDDADDDEGYDSLQAAQRQN